MAKCWIIVASKDHVQRGIEGGFAQACHGKASPLRRMQPGDRVVYYSPKMAFGGSEKCQCFTAIGDVLAEPVYQADMGAGFTPFRRDIRFLPSRDVPIMPLIPALSFIQNKQRWGYLFRFGVIEIPPADFEQIAAEMLAQEPAGKEPTAALHAIV